MLRSRDAVFVEDQTIEDIVKTKGQVPEHVPVHVSPQNQQQDRSDSDPEPAGSAEQEAENDAEDVQDDAHGGAGDEDAPEQHEYDAEEDDHDQEAPAPDSPPAAPLTRSTRNRVPSTRYPSDQYVVLLSDGSEPECFSDAMKDEKKKEWNKAMQEEMDSLHTNHTYELVKLPKGKKVLKNKWVYRIKQESTRHIQGTRPG